MKKEIRKNLIIGIASLLFFLLWTILVITIDQQPIGPNKSYVGLATLNKSIHNFIGVHMMLYHVTDWLSSIPFGFILFFAIIGAIQWINRKKIKNIDRNILFLGIFYIVILSLFFLFEVFPINYRPILIEGILEPSYPSSTTLLVLTTTPATIIQLKIYIKNRIHYETIRFILSLYISFMIFGRMISGVHWITDIIGGITLSVGMVALLRGLTHQFKTCK